MDKKIESAVSPVIGILLMLVVTIIIAAVVSGFAGGLGSTDKVPKATISGTFSQSGYMSITHNGGDTLATPDTRVVVRLSNEFGDVDYMSWDINKTILTSQVSDSSIGAATAWMRKDGYSGVKAWQAGETMYVPHAGLPYIQNTAVSSTYMINATANVGKNFWVELYDKSGKAITKSQVKINT
jgi:FlaG/FlaF family flagellin (archaellin)